MTDPVLAVDGHSYEREAIQAWLSKGDRRSPVTGLPLPSDQLIPNHSLRKAIEEFKQKGDEYRRSRMVIEEDVAILRSVVETIEGKLASFRF
jgi:hypothetical protein